VKDDGSDDDLPESVIDGCEEALSDVYEAEGTGSKCTESQIHEEDGDLDRSYCDVVCGLNRKSDLHQVDHVLHGEYAHREAHAVVAAQQDLDHVANGAQLTQSVHDISMEYESGDRAYHCQADEPVIVASLLDEPCSGKDAEADDDY
jgi:hypothetical protein